MNERFRELAEQSGAQFFPAMTDYFGDTHPSGVLTVKVDLEKFAELIVRECAGVNYKSPFRDGEFHAREVLEHFGVEE